MQLDWFTLVAQVVNFLILLYLLKRFLYGPIVEAMEQRDQKIKARLQEAQEKRSQAEEQAEQYQQQRQELEAMRTERMTDLKREIEQRRKELLHQAQAEIQEQKKDWQTALQQEQDAFLQDLYQQLGDEATEIARRALKDLADLEVEQRVAALFYKHLQELDPDHKSDIGNALRSSKDKAVIRSAFELRQKTQQSLIQQVQEQLLDGDAFDPDFQTSPELISGIELKVDGYQVSWNMHDYLIGLRSRVRQSIRQEIGEPQESEDDDQ